MNVDILKDAKSILGSNMMTNMHAFMLVMSVF